MSETWSVRRWLLLSILACLVLPVVAFPILLWINRDSLVFAIPVAVILIGVAIVGTPLWCAVNFVREPKLARVALVAESIILLFLYVAASLASVS